MSPLNVGGHKDVADYILEHEPMGLDRGIEAGNFRSTSSAVHTAMRALMLEGDSGDAFSSVIKAIRKGGNIALIGDFFFRTNQFPIGALTEKTITLRCGQLMAHKVSPQDSSCTAPSYVLGWLSISRIIPTYLALPKKEHMTLHSGSLLKACRLPTNSGNFHIDFKYTASRTYLKITPSSTDIRFQEESRSALSRNWALFAEVSTRPRQFHKPYRSVLCQKVFHALFIRK
jgi:hypothetical protein